MRKVWVLLATLLLIYAQVPTWPPNYSMHSNVKGTRNYEFDLYFDYDHGRYRFDSYGVPLFIQKYISNSVPVNAPLYIFLFRYDLGYLYSLWPGAKGWDCEKSRLPRYPVVPSLFNTSFVAGSTLIGKASPCDENYEVPSCYHFSRDFVLFAVDYFQDEKTNLPAEMIVGCDTFIFSNFTVGPQSASLFDIPKNATGC